MAHPTSTAHTTRHHLPRPSRVVWLWLLVIFVGIQVGGGLYEKLAIVPLWATQPGTLVLHAMTSSGMYTAGRAFWPFVSPPVAVLAVVNLALAWRSAGPARSWWLASATFMTVYAAFSYSFFVPQMLTLQAHAHTWPTVRIESLVDLWTTLNWPRMALGALGWMCGLRALSLSTLGLVPRSALITTSRNNGVASA